MTETLEQRQERLQNSLVFPRSGIIGWVNGEPIPAPLEIKLSELDKPTLAHLAVKVGWFPSTTQAMRNGFKGDATVGSTIRRKHKRPVVVVEG